MPRFAPLPERRPAIVAGASSGIGEATAIELAAHGFPVALGARRVEKLDDIVGKIRADGGEAVGFHLDVTDPNSVKAFVARPSTRSARSRYWWPVPVTPTSASCAEIGTDDFDSQLQIHLVGANRLATRGAAGHDRAPARRPDLRRLRRRTAPATAHGRLRCGEGRAGRDGHQLPDGTRRHRRARVDRAPWPDEDVDGLEPAGRVRSAPRWRTGPNGARPGTTTSCVPQTWRVPSRSSPRPRAAASSRTWNFSPKLHWPTTKDRQKLALGEEGLPS